MVEAGGGGAILSCGGGGAPVPFPTPPGRNFKEGIPVAGGTAPLSAGAFSSVRAPPTPTPPRPGGEGRTVAPPPPEGARGEEVVVGPGTFTLIAGPCSVENDEMILRTAEFLVSNGVRLMRAGAFKPRTSPYAF